MKHVYLVGDIGGTNTRLSVFGDSTLDGASKATLIDRKDYCSEQYESLVPIIKEYLSSLDKELAGRLQLAVFCVAGPVDQEGNCKLTNLPWKIGPSEITRGTPISFAHVQNDFKAAGYGTLTLDKEDYLTVNDVPSLPLKVIAVLGAGTGLGQCFVTFDSFGDRYVHSSEGGHTNFSPRDYEEWELFAFVQKKLRENKVADGGVHVSTERLLSGWGLCRIFEFYLVKHGKESSYKELLELQDNEKAKMINKTAFQKEKENGSAWPDCGDPLCLKTLQKFLALLGSEASNFALKVLPKGGMFIAGGIIVKLLSNCNNEQKNWLLEIIRINFFDKARMNYVLEKIPLHIVLREDLGLLGASYVGKRYISRFLKVTDSK